MNDSAAPLPTVRTLLAQRELGLRLVGAAAEDDALDRGAPWVHSSDLLNPAPFLMEGVVLLTTGTQFERPGPTSGPDFTDGPDPTAGPDAAATPDRHPSPVADAYVSRLAGAGVVALGFGTEVIRDGVPDALITACARHGMPLFEVPFQTPFIAVARAHAESVTRLAFARRSWALGAQRAIARAALQADGLGPTVQEFSRQMQAWVGLFDAAGSLTHQSLAHGARPAPARAVEDRARQLLARKSRATSVMRLDGQAVTLQTVGRGDALRGVLAVAGDGLDHEALAVMNSVVAMVGLASEQDASLVFAGLALRCGMVQLLLAGEADLAGSVAAAAATGGAPGAQLSGGLPEAPVVVMMGRELEASAEAIAAWVDSLPGRATRGLLLARREQGVVLVAPSEQAGAGLRELLRRFGGRWGVSSPADYQHFGEAWEQAISAVDRGTEQVSHFSELLGLDLMGSVRDPHARAAARALLHPLVEHDERHRTALLRTVASWLRLDGNHEATARELGVHRHTIRARLRTAEQIGGFKLDGFAARAELWAALRLAEPHRVLPS